MRKRIGEILTAEGVITEDQLLKALEIQKQADDLLGNILVRMGFCTEKDIIKAYSKQIDVEFLDLETTNLELDAVRLIPRDLANRYHVIPFKKTDSKLFVAMENPLHVFCFDELRSVTGLNIVPFIATPEEILKSIDEYYKSGRSITEALEDLSTLTDGETAAVAEVQDEEESFSIDELKSVGEEAPIVRMVNAIIMQAIRDKASDIHIEPQAKELRVRFRIDGILHEAMLPPKRLQAAIVSRVKILANMDIAEKRIPLDGRIMLQIEGKEFDFRVSTIPTMYGEKVEMRILDKTGMFLAINKIGMTPENQELFESLLTKPYGMIIASGPTGSGKTTTLYAGINKLNAVERNIITIEDPIEYQVEGIAQAQVNEKAGVTFASALRSILRQDPDVIMVGEIRDKETAEISIHSALTGHLVLTTMHTNDTSLTIVRLFHMGIEPFLVSSSLVGVVSQRLARKICVHCKEPYTASSEMLRRLGLQLQSDNVTLYRGKGCESCRFTGYSGRTGIFEILKINDDLRQMIVQKKTAVELRDFARGKGMKVLLDDALEKVLEGATTLEEAIRVVYIR